MPAPVKKYEALLRSQGYACAAGEAGKTISTESAAALLLKDAADLGYNLPDFKGWLSACNTVTHKAAAFIRAWTDAVAPALALRAPPVSPKEMARMGWTRTDGGKGKVGARWQHRDGWSLVHCGHPTALHPWALYDPKGRMHTTGYPVSGRPVFGVAWRNLKAAAEYVRDHGPAAIEAMDREEIEAPDLIRRSSAGSLRNDDAA